MIAPMVAVRMPEVSFLILMAGTGVPGDEITEAQAYRAALSNGAGEEAARQTREMEHAILNIIKSEPAAAARQSKLAALAEDKPALQQILKVQAGALNSP